NDGILHGAGFPKSVDDLRHRGALLADGDINADDVAALLIDDRVDGDGGFAGLAVADDQLALAAADGNHAVDRLQPGLERFFHRLARDDAGRLELDAPALFGIDRPAPVDGLAQRIHHPADQLFADRHFGDAAGALDRVAFFDHVGFAEERRADVVFFQVEGDAENIVRKLEQLAGGDLVEAVDARDAVAGGQHRADFLDLDGLFVVADLFFDDAADLGRADFHL